MKTIALKLINFYQFFSKDLGFLKNRCVFSPTCSDYTYEAIKKYGTMRGCFLGIKRIVRCYPGQKKYYDPLI